MAAEEQEQQPNEQDSDEPYQHSSQALQPKYMIGAPPDMTMRNDALLHTPSTRDIPGSPASLEMPSLRAECEISNFGSAQDKLSIHRIAARRVTSAEVL